MATYLIIRGAFLEVKEGTVAEMLEDDEFAMYLCDDPD